MRTDYSLGGFVQIPERDFEKCGRSEALGTSCMAASSHPLATLTALNVLGAGGNAIDAALSAVAVLGVVEPSQTGIGGDCFALYAPASGQRVIAMNGSGWAPTSASTERCRCANGSGIDPVSAHAVTVPGAVAAWQRLASDYGRWGLDRILAPAIRFARNGYVVTERVARDWRRQVGKLSVHRDSAETFLIQGHAPSAGTIHRQPKLAKTLQAIADGGPDAFYKGWIAEDLCASLRALGGVHELDDFSDFVPEYVEPIKATYRGYDVWECPPNGQGITPLIMLRTLERFDVRDLALLGAERLHLIGEIARLAYSIRDTVVGDPRPTSAASVDVLLSEAYVHSLAGRLSRTARMADLAVAPIPLHRDTVYLTVVDKDMNTVSFINSIFDDFGSGITGRNSGVLLHNRGSGFVTEPGHPNAITGRKRPLHTIIPGLLTHESRSVMAFGVTGGHFQPLGQVQLLSNLIDHGFSLQQAIDQPRFFARGETFEVEHGVPASTVTELRKLGHPVQLAENPIGTAQAIRIDWDAGVLHGAADGRRDGLALGY